MPSSKHKTSLKCMTYIAGCNV